MSNNNNPFVIAISAISTLIGGGGLYLQWTEHNKAENDTVKTEKIQSIQDEKQLVEKKVIVEKVIHSKNDNQINDALSKVATVNLSEDMSVITQPVEQHKKESKIQKDSINDLELPPATKGFDDFLEKDNL